jgi:hypothetical protein
MRSRACWEAAATAWVLGHQLHHPTAMPCLQHPLQLQQQRRTGEQVPRVWARVLAGSLCTSRVQDWVGHQPTLVRVAFTGITAAPCTPPSLTALPTTIAMELTTVTVMLLVVMAMLAVGPATCQLTTHRGLGQTQAAQPVAAMCSLLKHSLLGGKAPRWAPLFWLSLVQLWRGVAVCWLGKS